MKSAKIILNKILRPHFWNIIIISLIAFAGLIYIFARNETRGAAAYVFYVLSAYSLVILIINLSAGVPLIADKIRKFIAKRSESVKF